MNKSHVINLTVEVAVTEKFHCIFFTLYYMWPKLYYTGHMYASKTAVEGWAIVDTALSKLPQLLLLPQRYDRTTSLTLKNDLLLFVYLDIMYSFRAVRVIIQFCHVIWVMIPYAHTLLSSLLFLCNNWNNWKTLTLFIFVASTCSKHKFSWETSQPSHIGICIHNICHDVKSFTV